MLLYLPGYIIYSTLCTGAFVVYITCKKRVKEEWKKKPQKTKILMLEVTPVRFENNKHVVSVWIVDCLNDLQSKLIIIIYHCHGY